MAVVAPRQGVIAGLTASALHSAKWVAAELPVELVWPNARAPHGLRTSAMRLGEERHRLDPVQFAYDIERSEDLTELGWTRIRVVKKNRPRDILRRLSRAWSSSLRAERQIS